MEKCLYNVHFSDKERMENILFGKDNRNEILKLSSGNGEYLMQ